MTNGEFEHQNVDSSVDNASSGAFEAERERAERERRRVWMGIAAALGLAAIVAVVFWLRARRQTTLARTEMALASAAGGVERTARALRKRGPAIVERGARAVEHAAATVREQGPQVVDRSGERIEQLGSAIRTHVPHVVESAAGGVESAAATVREQAPGTVAYGAGQAERAARNVRIHGPVMLRKRVQQTERALTRGREVTAQIADTTGKAVDSSQRLFDRTRRFVHAA
jgi:hypothetical protein